MGSPDQTILTELSRSRSVRTSTPPSPSSTPPPPSRTSTLPPSSLELELPPSESLDQELESDPSWIPDHWLCQEPISQAAALLLCYFGICSVRGHGSVLFDDGILASLCFLNTKRIHMFILVV